VHLPFASSGLFQSEEMSSPLPYVEPRGKEPEGRNSVDSHMGYYEVALW
jgi:hypothetical protein